MKRAERLKKRIEEHKATQLRVRNLKHITATMVPYTGHLLGGREIAESAVGIIAAVFDPPAGSQFLAGLMYSRMMERMAPEEHFRNKSLMWFTRHYPEPELETYDDPDQIPPGLFSDRRNRR